MPNLAPGTIVANGECGCCAKPVKIKLNKNGTAYYFCPWVDDEGERCNHQQRWGRTVSQKMQRDYLAARKSNPEEVTAHDNRKPADLPDEPKQEQPATVRERDPDDIFQQFG